MRKGSRLTFGHLSYLASYKHPTARKSAAGAAISWRVRPSVIGVEYALIVVCCSPSLQLDARWLSRPWPTHVQTASGEVDVSPAAAAVCAGGALVRPCPLPLCSRWRERHPMHDRDPTEQFRAPAREPKPGTFHRPAHGFGMKRVREAAELRLRGPMTGEQKLGEGLRELPLVGNAGARRTKGKA